MNIGIFGSNNDSTVDGVVAEAAQAERDGFASYWQSQIFGLDALSVLSVVGREVPRIELGTSVIPVYPRHPMMLAQQALTANQAAGGRLTLGIGLGHKVVVEGMTNMSFDKPVRHMKEYLSILMPLIHNQKVSFAGEALTTHAELTIGKPQSCGVVVAALGAQMLKLAAAFTEGTLTWCTGPETLRTLTVPTIVQAAEQLGRPAPRIIAALPICVTKNVAEAKARAAKTDAIGATNPRGAGPEDVAIIGSASVVFDRVAALQEFGVTDFGGSEFGRTPDEAHDTREVLKSLLKR